VNTSAFIQPKEAVISTGRTEAVAVGCRARRSTHPSVPLPGRASRPSSATDKPLHRPASSASAVDRHARRYGRIGRSVGGGPSDAAWAGPSGPAAANSARYSGWIARRWSPSRLIPVRRGRSDPFTASARGPDADRRSHTDAWLCDPRRQSRRGGRSCDASAAPAIATNISSGSSRSVRYIVIQVLDPATVVSPRTF
jgi:hypothetical protein